MRNLIFTAGLIITLLGCGQSNSAKDAIPRGMHKVIALEKINTSNYTYVLVNENGVENWLALPIAEIKIGEPYYYGNEMLMTNFESKELGRIFEKIYFIQGLYNEPPTSAMENNQVLMNPQPLEQANKEPIEISPQVIDNSPVPGVHKGVALEKINTSQYTYLLLNEDGVKNWLAFPKSEIKIGASYYYKDGMQMDNFESKELNRTFEKVYFVEGVSVIAPGQVRGAVQTTAGSSSTAPAKANFSIEPAEGGITIEGLYSAGEQYVGKKVRIKGKVMKFSEGIMDRNWIHIQDGTDYKGNYDLTLTSQQEVKTGQTYTFEGTVMLNKDFGAGYTYEVLVEGAVIR